MLYSIQQYWCRHFILPQSVIKRITQLCSQFFWKGRCESAKGARVSWKNISYPKVDGGLGFKDILSWNRASIIQNIWAIFTKAGTLWIAWIKAYMLKGRSIWSISATQNNSWSWRKMLQLRPLARKFVKLENGVEKWKFLGKKYSVTDVWEELRPKQDKVPWHKFLWGSMAIPKHVFISWMAILNRLPTKDRLISWGMEVNGDCCLCQGGMESRDHMFFECNYSKELWKSILHCCGLNREVGTWNAELNWAMQKIKGKALISLILGIAWKAFVYHIWKERNRRIHGHAPETGLQVLESIKEVVGIKLAGIKHVADDSVNRRLYSKRGLSKDMFS